MLASMPVKCICTLVLCQTTVLIMTGLMVCIVKQTRTTA